MKGPHPKPGEVELNRIREFQEKCTQFEKDLLAAGRTEKEAEREAIQLALRNAERLKIEDPENYAYKRGDFEREPREFWQRPGWKL